MAFKRITKRIVTRVVEIPVPVDGTAIEKATIKVTWELVSNDGQRLYDKEFFQRVITDFADVENEDGTPFEFSKENLAALLSDDFVLAGMQQAYINCTIGAARGNF